MEQILRMRRTHSYSARAANPAYVETLHSRSRSTSPSEARRAGFPLRAGPRPSPGLERFVEEDEHFAVGERFGEGAEKR